MANHYFTDKNGYKCCVQIQNDEEIVVFDSKPKLTLDLKDSGIRIKKETYWDYELIFEIKDNKLYLLRLEAKFKTLFKKPPVLFGVEPTMVKNGLDFYSFTDLVFDYSGELTIGKDFDIKFYPKEDKARPCPCCPEVYKQNGKMIIKNGIVTEKLLEPRKP